MTPQDRFKQLLAVKEAERDSCASKLDRLQGELIALQTAYDITYGEQTDVPVFMANHQPRGAIAARLFDALVAAPTEGMTVKELALATSINRGTIKQNCSRWTAEGRIIRVSEGRYRADQPKEQADGHNERDGRDRGHEEDVES